MNSQVDIAVIILTYNQKNTTLRCLESISEANKTNTEILVWDNGSTDGTTPEIQKKYPEITVHNCNKNLGAADGRNAGANLAKKLWNPEFLLFLDNDTIVTPNLFEKLISPLKQDSTIGATTPKIRFVDYPDMIDSAGGCYVSFWLAQTPAVGSGEIDTGQFDTSKECIPGGCCMLTRSDLFFSLGGFDTEYGLYGPDDIDYSLCMKEAGFKSIYVPDVIIYHDETQTFENGKYSKNYTRQKTANWLRFMRRHAKPIEIIGFWLIGVPWRVLNAAAREIKHHNLRAISGFFIGGWNTIIDNFFQ